MNVIKSRLLNTVSLMKGPYRKRSSVEILLTAKSALSKSQTQRLKLESFGGNVPIDPIGPIGLRSSSGKLFLKLPKDSTLKKATFLGWETFWNGLNQKEVDLQGGKTFEVAIPVDGWWQVSTHSFVLDVQSLIDSSKEAAYVVSFWTGLKDFLFGKQLRTYVSAISIHAGLLLLAANFGFVIEKFNSAVLHVESKPPEEAAAAPGVAAMPAEAIEADSSFHGRSIFAAIHENKEKNFKAEDLTSGVKNLAKLLNKPIQGLPQVKAKSNNPNTSGMVASLKSLQTGLLGRAGSGTGTGTGIGKGGSGARDVRWSSDFQVKSGSSKGGLSEGQQQALYKIFSGYQDKFRGCYESALLKFDEMTVTVSFEAVVGGDGTVGKPVFTVSGRSTPDSQEVLTQCLRSLLTQIKVDKKMSGIKIKNQFIFKS